MVRFGSKLVPIHFVGVLLEGNIPVRSLGLTYKAGYGNGRHGISTGPAARVSGCTTWSNKGSGIRVEGHCVVQSCLASGNSGAGILVLSRGTRIDGNHGALAAECLR